MSFLDSFFFVRYYCANKPEPSHYFNPTFNTGFIRSKIKFVMSFKAFSWEIWIIIKFERNLRVNLRIILAIFGGFFMLLTCFNAATFKIEVASILFPEINRFAKIFSSYSEPLIHQLSLWTMVLDLKIAFSYLQEKKHV